MEKRLVGNEIRDLFSRNLKLLRSKKKLSQLALSARAGLAHNFVNDIENGKKWVSPDTIAKLAVVLEVEPGAFFQSNPLDAPQAKVVRAYLAEMKQRFAQALDEIEATYLSKKDNAD